MSVKKCSKDSSKKCSCNQDNNDPEEESVAPNPALENITNSCKKNMEILKLMSKSSMDLFKNASKLQTEFLQKMMADLGDMTKVSKPGDVMAKFSEITKNGMVQAINNGRKINDMMSASSNELSSTVTKRLRELM